MAKRQTKKCSRCGEVKLRSEFYKDKNSKDGLAYTCKLCVKITSCKNATYKDHHHKQDDAELKSLVGAGGGRKMNIVTWLQADSVLRELCEVELSLKAETVNRNKRILQIKSESDGLVEKLKNRSTELFRTLEAFALRENRSLGLQLKSLRFGMVRVCGGECEIDLNLLLAIETRGKP